MDINQPASLLEVIPVNVLSPVAGHVGASYRGCLICWGGHNYDSNGNQFYRPTDCLYIYPFALADKYNMWFKVKCTGPPIRCNTSATAGVHRDSLYIFGGLAIDHQQRPTNINELIIFDLKRTTYRIEENNSGTLPTPRDKSTSWICDDKFFIFGGYGVNPSMLHEEGQLRSNYFYRVENFHGDDGRWKCWNNQLLFFDIFERKWVEARQGGSLPSPRAATASVYVADLHKVFLFGGRHASNRLSDLYELDMRNLIWTRIDLSDYCPAGRSWFSFNLIPSKRRILLYGGLADPAEGNRVFGDVWELDISPLYRDGGTATCHRKGKKMKWRMVSHRRHHLPPRIWHTGVSMGISYGNPTSCSTQAIIFYGGMSRSPSENAFMRTLLRLRVSPPSLFTTALLAVASLRKIHPLIHSRAQRILPVSIMQHLTMIEAIDKCSSHCANKKASRLNLLDVDHSGATEEERNGDLSEFPIELIKLTKGKCSLLYTLFNVFDV